MYVCTYVRMYVCKYVRMYVCTYVRMYVCTYVRMYVCTYVRRYVRMYVCTYVRMYVCTYVRTYVRMYVCVCDKVACERWCVWKWRECATVQTYFFPPALQCHLPCMRHHCGPGMGWMRCSMIFCAPCGWQSCVWKLCVKDGVWQSCVVCDRRAAGERGGRGVSNKVERWCVTKWCVKEGVWKMVCDKVACESCVWKRYVKDGGWQSCVWKLYVKDAVWQSCVVCDRRAAGGRGGRGVSWVPRLPRKTKVNVRWCHACHVKRRWMSPSATPATQSAAASRATKPGQCHECHACHAKPRWMWGDATPATWNEGGCHQVPRLPRKVPRRHARLNRAQARHPVPWVPRLPRKTKVNVRRCHACHVKRRWMWPSATPATQSAAASRATKPGQCHECHACHAKPRWMWEDATPATWNEGGCHPVPRLPRKVPRRHARLNRAQARHPVPWVPRLPRKTKVNVRRYHACHVKRRWMWPSATPATQSAAASRATKSGPSAPPSAMIATPATQNQGGCEIVPRLPHETKVDVTKCHACHAKCPGVTRDLTGPKGATQCHECHACHAKPRWMWDCATPATWNEGGCHQVPRLPRKVPRPVPWVPRLPHKTKVDVRLRHACHVKRRWMSPSATPATQSAAASRATKSGPSAPLSAMSAASRATKSGPSAPPSAMSATPATQNRGGWWDCATPATQSAAASRATKPGPRAPPSAMSATPATQNQGGCEIVPRLLRETKVDVTKCHACHAKCRGVTCD